MRKNEWKIIGVFLGIIAGAVLVLSLTTEGNIFHVPDQEGVSIEDLQRERSFFDGGQIDLDRVRKEVRDQKLSPEDVKKLRTEIEKHGFSIQDGKVIRKDR